MSDCQGCAALRTQLEELKGAKRAADANAQQMFDSVSGWTDEIADLRTQLEGFEAAAEGWRAVAEQAKADLLALQLDLQLEHGRLREAVEAGIRRSLFTEPAAVIVSHQHDCHIDGVEPCNLCDALSSPSPTAAVVEAVRDLTDLAVKLHPYVLDTAAKARYERALRTLGLGQAP